MSARLINGIIYIDLDDQDPQDFDMLMSLQEKCQALFPEYKVSITIK